MSKRAALAESVAPDGAIAQWFTTYGMPHFIEGPGTQQDVFEPASPVLIALFPLQILADVAVAGALLAGLAAAGIAVPFAVAATLVNRSSSRLWLSSRQWAGALTGIFVLTGPIAALAGGAALSLVGLTVLLNVALVIAVLLWTTLMVGEVLKWVIRRIGRTLQNIGLLAARALPMLVIFTVLTFFSNDLWHVAYGMGDVRLLAVLGAFVVLGLLFLWTRLPEEIDKRLKTEYSKEEVRAAWAGARQPGLPPLDELIDPGAVAFEKNPHITDEHRLNMRVFLLLNQAIQVGLLTVLVWIFFLIFGRLAVTDQVLRGWFGGPPQYPGRVFNVPIQLFSTQLLDASAFLAIFAGVYFTVSAVADSDYREEFFERTVNELIEAVKVRCAYLTLRRENEQPVLVARHSSAPTPPSAQ